MVECKALRGVRPWDALPCLKSLLLLLPGAANKTISSVCLGQCLLGLLQLVCALCCWGAIESCPDF